MISFLVGLFIGFVLGFLALSLLAAPRVAELEATVQGLRQVLANLTDQSE